MSGLDSCVSVSRGDLDLDGMIGGNDEIRRLYAPGAKESIGFLNGGMGPIMNPKDLIRSEKLFDDEEMVGINNEAGRKDAGVRTQLMSGECIPPVPSSWVIQFIHSPRSTCAEFV